MTLVYGHILGATDFSELGNLAVRRAAEMAVAADARFTAMHVLPTLEMPSPLIAHYDVTTSKGQVAKARHAAESALRELLPPALAERDRVGFEVRLGDPAQEILRVDIQLNPDLIVLATHGYRGWKRWVMGSVAQRVLQLATADVLAIRDRGPSEVAGDALAEPGPEAP